MQQYMSELLKVQTPQQAELKLPLTMLENVVARTCYVRRAGAQALLWVSGTHVAASQTTAPCRAMSKFGWAAVLR